MSEDTYRFMAGEGDLSGQPRDALLAVCIAQQQAAGFGHVIDLRLAPCPDCKAPGFNTGWGFWRHVCGAEILSGGETSTACPTRAEQ